LPDTMSTCPPPKLLANSRQQLGGIVVTGLHEGIRHPRHRRMREAFAAPIAGRRDAHQPRVEAILHIALQDAVFDQDRLAGRGAFVVDAERAAAGVTVVDDALADPAGKGAGALAVEVAFQAVADRLVKHDARPARPEQHRHLSRGRRDRVQID
jgi:hypothetical protein